MSRGSLRSAVALEKVDIRSSVNRYYYAAYQVVTAVLHYRGDLVPPEDRQAWNHDQTPKMIKPHFSDFIGSKRTLNSMVGSLTYLYQLRVYADYFSDAMPGGALAIAEKDATFLIRTCNGILHQGSKL